MERLKLQPRKMTPKASHRYVGEGKDTAAKALRRARIDALFESGAVDAASGLPAFLDRRKWSE